MEFKSKKLIAMAGVVAVMATGCGAATNVDGTNDSESAELDRFLAANVEQSCYVKDYVGDKDPNSFTEEQLKSLEEKSLEILRDNGFEVTTVDEAMALSQRLYDASLAAGTIDQYDEKFITMMLEEECMTEEEAASIRASKAAAAQGTQPVVTGEEGTPTEDVELPPEVPPVEATEMPLTTEEEPTATTTPEEVVLPPEVPPTQ